MSQKSTDEIAAQESRSKEDFEYVEIVNQLEALANSLPTEKWAEIVAVIEKWKDFFHEDDLGNLQAFLIPESEFSA